MKKGFISGNNVKKIIDEGSNNKLYGIKFNIRGEPLLHSKIDYFIRYAKQKNIMDVYLNTNAVCLTEEMSIKLIKAGLDRISISFDGCTKEIYEKNRIGAEYEKVLENIKSFKGIRDEMNVGIPKIRVQTIFFPEIEFTLKEYKKFWEDMVDEISILDYKNMQFKQKGIKFSWACPQIWQRMGVWWDGTILSCNHDDGGLSNLGNIETDTIKESWHSGKLNKIRKFHKNGKSHTVEMCNGCFLRNSEIAKFI